MTPGEAALALAAMVGSLSGLAALLNARHAKKSGVSSDERDARRDAAEDRRDTIADRDRLVDQLQEDVAGMRTEMNAMRARVAAVEAEYRAEAAWNLALVAHIYAGKPPPPPPRPEVA